MRWKGKLALGLAATLSSAMAAKAQSLPTSGTVVSQVPVVQQDAPSASTKIRNLLGLSSGASQGTVVQVQADKAPGKGGTDVQVQDAPVATESAPAAEPPCCGTGPTPLLKVGIIEKALYGDNAENVPIHVSGWADFDYTFRSTGPGVNNVAPVMNRFGDEALVRQLGIYLYRPTKPDELSFGFNCIFIGGADASFLTPTAGGWANTNPRFGSSFTDLNVTAHLPILTEGGVDVKIGRQTTCLGPMGALPWQRYFDSSDYAWYNLEEGRYTGISAVWNINKQLSWYNGVEVGGWGVFFDDAVHGFDYLTQINYWLDCEAKKTKVWTTVLSGPTDFAPGMSGFNTTVLELGILHNWSDCWYQIVDTQMVWSRGGLGTPYTPNYHENAYDVYTYLGRHMTDKLDINSRFEIYDDQDGLMYPGGFGNGKQTTYFAVTVGPDYHPTKWLQIRPEIRYDHATNPNFGPNNTEKNQLSLAFEALFKF